MLVVKCKNAADQIVLSNCQSFFTDRNILYNISLLVGRLQNSSIEWYAA
jgi:hypothetical protein